ncbi:MAG: NADH-quinone oxidoreductase subunit N [Planctomycetota bacterium]|jgi:NADH-quinone oxidoreductase subunit N
MLASLLTSITTLPALLVQAGTDAAAQHAEDTARITEHFDAVSGPIKSSLGSIMPELLLAAAAMLIVILDLFTPKAKSRSVTNVFAFVALLVVGGVACMAPQDGAALFPGYVDGAVTPTGMLTVDSLSWYFKMIFVGGTLVTVLYTALHTDFAGQRMGEYWLLMLTSVLGMFLMVTSTDFLMAYLGIEMVSLTSFILVAYTRNDTKASEAALKYVIYGAVASALMLFGVSYLYGVSGSVRFADIPQMMEGLGNGAGAAVAVLLTLCGVGYKIAMVPLHFWAPDVYEGAPTPITAWLSVTSKAAGIGLLLRMVVAATPPGTEVLIWPTLVAVLAAATMTLGNFAALRQTNLKRLLAYSSVAHAGYLMMAIAAVGRGESNALSFQSIAFYLTAYALMNLAAFGIVLFVRNSTGREDLDAYRGLGWRHPWVGVAFTVLLFSLIGIPPMAGFFGKLFLFQAVISAGGLIWLAVVAGINTAVSAYYYMSVVKTMYLEEADAETPAVVFAPAGLTIVMALTIPVFVLGIFATPLLNAVSKLTFAALGGN